MAFKFGTRRSLGLGVGGGGGAAGSIEAWNADDKDAAVAISGAGRTASASSASAVGVRSVGSKLGSGSDKKYVEFLIGGSGTVWVGIVSPFQSLTGTPTNNGATVSSAGGGYTNNGIQPTSVSFGAGDIIGMAWDAGTDRAYFFKNGVAFSGQDVGAGTGGLASNGGNGHLYANLTTGSVTMNAGHEAFAHAPPAGYTAWG